MGQAVTLNNREMALGIGVGVGEHNDCSSFLSVAVTNTLTKSSLGEGIVYLGDSLRLQFIIRRMSRQEFKQSITAHLQSVSEEIGYT